jgi:quinol monooxygenase YgiN
VDARPYSSGVWIAKPGREAEFVKAWHDFADWSLHELDNHGWAMILQDREQPNRFLSIGPWDSQEQLDRWRAHPGFREHVGVLRELIESLEPHTLDVVAEVGHAPGVDPA